MDVLAYEHERKNSDIHAIIWIMLGESLYTIIILICKGSEDKTWGNLYKNEAAIYTSLFACLHGNGGRSSSPKTHVVLWSWLTDWEVHCTITTHTPEGRRSCLTEQDISKGLWLFTSVWLILYNNIVRGMLILKKSQRIIILILMQVIFMLYTLF